MARRSRKGEFRHGFIKGMQDAFNRVIFLPTLESAEANRAIFFKSAGRCKKAWEEYRTKVTSLDDAYTCGMNEGAQAWENDAEMDQIAKMAKVSVITKS